MSFLKKNTAAKMATLVSIMSVSNLAFGQTQGSIPVVSQTNNTAVGDGALTNVMNGNGNTAVGSLALFSNTDGSSNTALGHNSLTSNTTGFGNNATGQDSLVFNTTGAENSAYGRAALNKNTTGGSNSAFGNFCLFLNSTGFENSAFGFGSSYKNTTGRLNATFGAYSGFSNVAGIGNTAIGHQALIDKKTGNYNVALGYNSGSLLSNGNNNLYVANTGSLSESNTIRIGQTHTKTFLAGVRGITTDAADTVTVVIDSNGQLGTLNSSERFKKDIQDMDGASRRLLELRPVTYHYKQASEDGKNPLEYGLIAEEVAQVYPDLVVHGRDGKIETVQYQKLTPMLLNELQRLASLQAAQANELGRLKLKLVSFEKEQSEFRISKPGCHGLRQAKPSVWRISHVADRPPSYRIGYGLVLLGPK